MSDLIVKIVKVDEIIPMPHCHSIEAIRCSGWCCVTGKGNFKVGDLAIYLPPEDSVLPDSLCNLLWGPESKIRPPKGGRLRTEKIQKFISQGMCLNPKSLTDQYPKLANAKLGDDVAAILGITKYEPPAYSAAGMAGDEAKANSKFDKYTNLQNIKHYTDLFTKEDVVVITEKLHGANMRVANLEKTKLNLFEKIKRFFGFKTFEFLVGSRNVNLKHKEPGYELGYGLGTTSDNVYIRAARQLELDKKVSAGEILYGEVLNVQKNYSYGLKSGEVAFVAFDVKKDGKYLTHNEFNKYCVDRGIPFAPILYIGNFSMDKVAELTEGVSVYHKSQQVREGVVVKSAFEKQCPQIGRMALKSISTRYLLKDQSEFQ